MAYFPLKTRAILLSAAAVAVMASAAQAGFEWKGPLTPPVKAPAAAPAPSGDMGGLEPVISWGGAEGVQPPAEMPAVKPAEVEKTAAEPLPAEIAADAGMAIPAESAALDGFGADLPLVIALQQVAPAGYRVSFGPGVNPGAIVSWSGGKPWKDVLSDMLAAKNFAYSIEDGTIMVTTAPVEVAPAPAPAPAPVPVPLSAPPVEEPIAWAPPVAPPAPAPEVPAPAVKAPESAPALKAEDLSAPPVSPGERILLGKASETGISTRPAPPAAPVEIRRAKPSGLLERFGLGMLAPKGDVAAVPAPAVAAPESVPAPAPKAQQKAPKKSYSVVDGPLPDAPVSSPVPDISAPPALDSTPLEPVPLVPVKPAEETKLETKPETRAEAAPVAEQVDSVPPLETGDAAAETRDAVKKSVAANATPASAAIDSRWHGAKGQTLRAVLKEWSETAGVELYWSIDYDYRLDADIDLSGTYDEAVGRVLDAFSAVRPQPYGRLHQASDGPRVLVIKSYDLAG